MASLSQRPWAESVRGKGNLELQRLCATEPLGGDSYRGEINVNDSNTIDLSESDFAWRIAFDPENENIFLGGLLNADWLLYRDPIFANDTPFLGK